MRSPADSIYIGGSHCKASTIGDPVNTLISLSHVKTKVIKADFTQVLVTSPASCPKVSTLLTQKPLFAATGMSRSTRHPKRENLTTHHFVYRHFRIVGDKLRVTRRKMWTFFDHRWLLIRCKLIELAAVACVGGLLFCWKFF